MHKARSVTAVFAKTLVLLALLLACSACAWLDTKQRQIIYRPTPAPSEDSAAASPFWQTNDARLFLQVPGQTEQQVALWWLPHTDPMAPTLLYLHGTFRNLLGNQPKIEALRQAGFSILAVDYRGWGQSTSITPSEQSIIEDALLAWGELVRREPRAAQRVIYGHSMGSGVAVALASQLNSPANFGALILESAFTSFADIAAEAGFWASLAIRFNHERFASIDCITRIKAPLLMLHGALDRTVPMLLGQRLFAAANEPKEWVMIGAGQHSDLHRVGQPTYQETIAAFKSRYLSQPQ